MSTTLGTAFADHPASEADIVRFRDAVRVLRARLSEQDWREKDRKRAITKAIVQTLTEASSDAVLIPEENGGGIRLRVAAAILEAVHSSIGSGATCHAQEYMGIIMRRGSEAQKAMWPSMIAPGELRKSPSWT